MSTQDVYEGFIRHAAMAQLHRWVQFYEHSEAKLENQLDILDEAVFVKSDLGEATGHEAYAERLKALPGTWLNAHFVSNPNFVLIEDGTVQLSADVRYVNKGMLADGAVRGAELSYTMELSPTNDVLPKFTRIEIAQVSNCTLGTFSSAYEANRLASLLHYWLALIEDPRRNPEPVREILAEGFSLNFSSGGITEFDEFKEWLEGPGSQIPASTYTLSDLVHEDYGNQTYSLSAVLDWRGILPDGREVGSKTRHDWIVEDDPSERFARIKTMDVAVVRKPPKSDEE